MRLKNMEHPVVFMEIMAQKTSWLLNGWKTIEGWIVVLTSGVGKYFHCNSIATISTTLN